MSIFSGKQAKGAMRQHRKERRERAVARQMENIERGFYRCYNFRHTDCGARHTPAPIEQFVRKPRRNPTNA